MNLPFGLGRKAKPPGPGDFDLAEILREREKVIKKVAEATPPITRVLPVSRVVRMGGRDLVVEELRLSDYAELQAYVEAQHPGPLDGLPPVWADPDSDTRKERLAGALEAARTWPPKLGSDQAAVAMATPNGRAYFLTLVARKGQPSFGIEAALGVLAEVTPAEWSAFMRAAYGITAAEEILSELVPLSRGTPTDWCKSLDMLMEHRGLTYEEMGNLTLSQFHNACAAGRAVEKTQEFGSRLKRAWKILKG